MPNPCRPGTQQSLSQLDQLKKFTRCRRHRGFRHAQEFARRTRRQSLADSEGGAVAGLQQLSAGDTEGKIRREREGVDGADCGRPAVAFGSEI